MKKLPELPKSKNPFKGNRVYKTDEFVFPEVTPYSFPNYIDGFLDEEIEKTLVEILNKAETEHPDAVSYFRTSQLSLLRSREVYEGLINAFITAAQLLKDSSIEYTKDKENLVSIYLLQASVCYSLLREGKYVVHKESI